MYVLIEKWDEFMKVVEAKGIKILYYTILEDTRQVAIRCTDGHIIYEHITPPDEFPYYSGIYINPVDEIKRLTRPIQVENEILGGKILYLVGSQKIRGFDMWCVYSNFSSEVREFMAKQLKDKILVEGRLEEGCAQADKSGNLK